MKRLHKALLMPWAGGGGIAYLLLDRFTTNASAPLTTPRTCEPGPGTLTIVDTNSIISIASQRLTINGTPAVADRVVTPATYARAAGRAFFIVIPTITTVSASGGVRIGWDAGDNGSALDIGIDIADPTSYRIKTSVSVIDTLTFPSIPIDIGYVMRGTGGFLFMRGGGSGMYTLLWVYNTLTTAEYAKIFLNSNTADNLTLDDFRIFDLGGGFTTDNGIATAVSTSPSANATITANADAVIEFTITAATGVAQELRVRWTDDNNCWIVRMAAPGANTIKLIEKNVGVETERASAAQTFTNGVQYRIVVTCETQTIKTYVANVAKNSYTSASFNQTVGGCKVDTAGANLISWPRTVTIDG